jgi:hypothetical protein
MGSVYWPWVDFIASLEPLDPVAVRAQELVSGGSSNDALAHLLIPRCTITLAIVVAIVVDVVDLETPVVVVATVDALPAEELDYVLAKLSPIVTIPQALLLSVVPPSQPLTLVGGLPSPLFWLGCSLLPGIGICC